MERARREGEGQEEEKGEQEQVQEEELTVQLQIRTSLRRKRLAARGKEGSHVHTRPAGLSEVRPTLSWRAQLEKKALARRWS